MNYAIKSKDNTNNHTSEQSPNSELHSVEGKESKGLELVQLHDMSCDARKPVFGVSDKV